jgi:hypothetical protein
MVVDGFYFCSASQFRLEDFVLLMVAMVVVVDGVYSNSERKTANTSFV